MTEQPPARILIADDDANVRLVLAHSLRNIGCLATVVASGEEALAQTEAGLAAPFDLYLLDLQMGEVGGIQALNQIRRWDPDAVVIILTGHGGLESALEALRLGAFDYLIKPAATDVIRQRVSEGLAHRRQALHRRRLMSQIETLRQTLQGLEAESRSLQIQPDSGRFIRSGGLVIDYRQRLANLNSRSLDLTSTELDLLVCLVQSAPRPVAARSLLQCALGYEAEDAEASEIIKVHIHHLRQKIEADPAQPKYIKTVRYKGYLWSGG